MENELKKILGTNLLMEILKNNKLLLLNYSIASVHFYKINNDADLDYDYIKKLGFNRNRRRFDLNSFSIIIIYQ